MKKHLWILALLIVGLSVWHLQAPVEFDDNGNPLRTAIDDPNALQRGRQTVPVGDRVLPSEYHPDQGTVPPRSTNQQLRNTATTITAPVTVKPTGELFVVDPTGAQQTDVTDDLGGG